MGRALAWNHLFGAIGYVASALVLATFSMKSLRSLRITAIASNLAFIAYAALGNMPPILILHTILLPLNIVRLIQIDDKEPRRPD
jgi:CRP/FNR family cyclic AMP-dependent transcriptional regulator